MYIEVYNIHVHVSHCCNIRKGSVSVDCSIGSFCLTHHTKWMQLTSCWGNNRVSMLILEPHFYSRQNLDLFKKNLSPYLDIARSLYKMNILIHDTFIFHTNLESATNKILSLDRAWILKNQALVKWENKQCSLKRKSKLYHIGQPK